MGYNFTAPKVSSSIKEKGFWQKKPWPGLSSLWHGADRHSLNFLEGGVCLPRDLVKAGLSALLARGGRMPCEGLGLVPVCEIPEIPLVWGESGFGQHRDGLWLAASSSSPALPPLRQSFIGSEQPGTNPALAEAPKPGSDSVPHKYGVSPEGATCWGRRLGPMKSPVLAPCGPRGHHPPYENPLP